MEPVRVITATFATQTLLSAGSSSHPNKMKFSGVLVRLDEPSTKPPNGSHGHRIMVPAVVAKSRLDTLIGMGLNYSPDLEGHAHRRKVGVIEKAWIKGKDLWVSGTVWKHDFPEAVEDLKQSGLGMSMELGNVQVADQTSRVWELTDFHFLGATILWKDSAAYYDTKAIAANAEQKGTIVMAVKRGKEAPKVISITAGQLQTLAKMSAAAAVKELKPQLDRLEELSASVADLGEAVNLLAAEQPEEDAEVLDITAGDEDACEDDMKGAGKKMPPEADDEELDDEDDEDDDMESAVDKGDLTEVGPKLGDSEEGDTPGEFNKDVKNKGSQTQVEDKVGKNVNKSILSSTAVKVLQRQLKVMQANQTKLEASNKELTSLVKKMRVQVKAAARDTNRQTVAPELLGLLRKNNVDPEQLRAAGEPLSVSEFDAMLNGVPNLDTTTRMSLKAAAARCGFMEEGQVNRQRH